MNHSDESTEPPADISSDDQDSAELSSPRTRRLRVLRRVAVAAAVVLALYAASPWLLPLRIVEGPLVQQATEDGAVLVWYTSRRAECVVAAPSNADAEIHYATIGRRHVARLGGLSAAADVPYRITTTGGRVLFDGRLRTNKPAGAAFSFIVFGDSGKATSEQYRLAAEMTALRPDFVLHTGDLVYSRGARRDFAARFFRPYRELISETAFWPSLGNHDVAEPDLGVPFLDVFELPENGPSSLPPERNYWFDYADARIAVIDSNLEADALAQHVAPWLEEVLAAPEPHWRFVVFHQPPYPAGAHAPAERIRTAVVPVLEATGVDLVFNGHDHLYERLGPIRGGQSAETGPVYIVTGAGGARLYEAMPSEQWPDYVRALRNDVHSFTHVSVDGGQLTLRQIALGGELLDEWVLDKAPSAP